MFCHVSLPEEISEHYGIHVNILLLMSMAQRTSFFVQASMMMVFTFWMTILAFVKHDFWISAAKNVAWCKTELLSCWYSPPGSTCIKEAPCYVWTRGVAMFTPGKPFDTCRPMAYHPAYRRAGNLIFDTYWFITISSLLFAIVYLFTSSPLSDRLKSISIKSEVTWRQACYRLYSATTISGGVTRKHFTRTSSQKSRGFPSLYQVRCSSHFYVAQTLTWCCSQLLYDSRQG